MTEGTTKTYSVRDMIRELANCDDMEALVTVTLFNSDPVTVSDIEVQEGQVVLNAQV